MKNSFEDLVELSRYLRSPDGCPWDREQDLTTLKSYIIEETYEVIQAIESGDINELIEELGDLLYQVVFASQIASDERKFSIDDVIDQLHNKLVRRHPHVFGEEKAKDAEEAVKKWHSQKLKEKSRKRKLVEIPRAMPSLLRAQRVGDKVSQVGFDWDNVADVISKVKEELEELEKEIKDGEKGKIEKEWGDLVFAIVNLGRHLNLDAESISHLAIDKFIDRFSKVEDMVNSQGKQLTDLTLEEMDRIWEEEKSHS